MEANGTEKPRLSRSPNYPAISLSKAVERAGQLHAKAGKHPVPLTSAVQAWGYGPKSSGGPQTAAALKQYGLLSDSGSGAARRVALTPLGRELIVYGGDKESPRWKERIQKAALAPTIHQELWKKYAGEMPDDSMILPDLILEKGFGNEAAQEVLDRFRENLKFADVTAASGTVSGNGEDNGDEQEEAAEDQLVPPATLETPSDATAEPQPGREQREQRTIQVTYSPTEWALVQAKFPLSEADWDSMIAVLQAMKRGLVSSDRDE